MKTYKNLINDLEVFANRHLQIKSFVYGLKEMTTKDYDYPMLKVEPSTINIDCDVAYYSYNISVLDLLKHDDSLNIDVCDDTLLIVNDLISYFQDYKEDGFTINTNTNGEYEEGVYDDLLGGWTFDIEIETQISRNECSIPLEPLYIPMEIDVTQLTNINCYGGTCELFVSVSGGTSPYIGTGLFTVSAGTHTFTVTDDNNFSVEKTITITQPDELIATAVGTVNERIREPFLSEIEITATGGTAPYTCNTNLGYKWNSNSIVNIYNSGPSAGIYTVLDDTSFTFETTTIYGNFPIVWFFYDNTFINGNDYLITFDYEWLEGYSSGILLRDIGTFGGSYSVLKTAAPKGNVATQFSMSNDGEAKFGLQFHYLSGGENVKVKITNLKIFYLDETFDNILPTSDLKPFGTGYSYNITDANGCTATTNEVSLEVPTPDGSLRVTTTDGGMYQGHDTFFRLYINTEHPLNDGYTYVNYGDGTIESFNLSTGYHEFSHTYAPEFKHKLLPVDIYGSIHYYRFIEGSKFTIEPEFFAKVGSFYDRDDGYITRLYMYSGSIAAPINECKNAFGKTVSWLYFYYNGIPWGDIGLTDGNEYIYAITYYPGPNNLVLSNRLNLYGDIGTALKNNQLSTGEYFKYLVTYCGSHTYTDRLDGPYLSIGSGNYSVYCRGYTNTASYWSISDPNQVAQLIIDLDTWWVNPSGGIILLSNNASPNDADEPYLSQFIAAKANLIANGASVTHS